jgi:coenzyme Q-binding protein COQ10
MEGIFESLDTRWTVRPVKAAASSAAAGGGGEWTEVTLSVTFQFANPALGFAVGQLADDKVTEMVEAFEGRARALYGNGNGR